MTARRRALAPLAWQSQAACSVAPDPEAFFPERGQESGAVLVLCASCPVRTPCRDQALTERQRYGIWGGTTERDRERVWEELARRRRGDPTRERSA